MATQLLLAYVDEEGALDALIGEVYGKPRLGIEDSAGLMDYDARARAYFDMDDDAPSLGLVFADEEDDYAIGEMESWGWIQ